MDRCDLCGSTEYEVVWDKTEREKNGVLDNTVVVRDNFGHIINGTNVICKNCGLVYISPQMNDKGYKQLCESYRTGYPLPLTEEQSHAKTVVEILSKAKALAFPFFDVGASGGSLIKIVRQIADKEIPFAYSKSEIVGIDSSPLGENVVKAYIEDFNTETRFKCVTIINTLEHMISPTRALEKIYSLMADDGVLLVGVPNVLNMCIHLPVDAFLSSAHLYNFSLDTLLKMLAKCGFKPTHATMYVEEIGEKIYILSVKDKPIVPKYKQPNVGAFKSFLNHTNKVYWTNAYLRGIAK